MQRPYSLNMIRQVESIRKAMTELNALAEPGKLTMFVLDVDDRLVGTLTDGDIRRALLKGVSIDAPVSEAMHRKFRLLRKDRFSMDDLNRLRLQQIELVPVLDDDDRIVRIVRLKGRRGFLPVDAFLLAGGEGKRLRPLTDDTPKPLLKVGDKPIIQHNVERLMLYGIDHLHVSVNYLAEQIEVFFKEFSGDDLQVTFVRETSPLGTIGSLSLVDRFEHDTILVMNSDLLTNIDFEDFYRAFITSGADMAVAGVPYKVDVPYAVMEIREDRVLSFKEKPTYTYYSNGGIYLMKLSVLKFLPQGAYFNATDLMEKLIAADKKLVYYPILGYWLDIGQQDDYFRAQEDVKHIHL